MRILLIGNKGQIGREIEELAQRDGVGVIGCDIDECDIVDIGQIMALFKQHSSRGVVNFDVAINAAAYTAVDKAEDEVARAYAVNCDGIKNLALVCQGKNVPLLHISTDYVFSGEKTGAYTENDEPTPMSTYGKTKLAGERALQELWEKHIILRVSWVFGKYGNNFVKSILRAAKERDVLNIVGDQCGCPTEAADVARVLLEMATKITQQIGKYGVYHYCGMPATNWYDFAEKIVELGREKFSLHVRTINKITTAEYPTKACRPPNSELAVGKIMRDFGVTRSAWLDGLKKVINEVVL